MTRAYFRERDKNPHWKGGKIIRIDGYVLIRRGAISQKAKGARYVLEHRLIMEKMLGRVLRRNEIVHHLNGNKSDNRIKNLKVISQAVHAKQHYSERKINKKGQFV